MRVRAAARALIYQGASWVAKHAAPAYVAGNKLEDALRVSRRFAGKGWLSTICPWDTPGSDPRRVFDAYREALLGILHSDLDCYLSIKLPSLGYDEYMVRELFAIAAPRRIRVHFDALAEETAERTLLLVEKLRADFAAIGCTLPASWPRSLTDAERLRDLGLAIRVVKGQWGSDAAAPGELRSRYLRIVEMLAGRTGTLVAVASHDAPLALRALELLDNSESDCELEQLYGLPLIRSARPGLRRRIYVPYAAGYLPYAVSQLRRRPWVAWWLIRDLAQARLRALSGSC